MPHLQDVVGKKTSVCFLGELFSALLHRDFSLNPLPFICPAVPGPPLGLFAYPLLTTLNLAPSQVTTLWFSG